MWTATSSSIYGRNGPLNALNRILGWPIFHSLNDYDEWFQVNFGYNENVHGVEIVIRDHNFVNIGFYRFRYIQVRVGLTDSQPIEERPLCFDLGDEVIPDRRKWMPCAKPLLGRFLSVMRKGKSILEFDEIFIIVDRSKSI